MCSTIRNRLDPLPFKALLLGLSQYPSYDIVGMEKDSALLGYSLAATNSLILCTTTEVANNSKAELTFKNSDELLQAIEVLTCWGGW